MEKRYRDAEYSLPPPEFIEPAREFRPEPYAEYTPLPPEYGQGTSPQAEPPERKRRLKKLLAIPAILLICFLFTHTMSAAPGTPGSTPDEIPAVTDGFSRGDIVIDVLDQYMDIEGDTLNYAYMLYDRSNPGAFSWPTPVTVYESVTDEEGHSAEPAGTPDVWTDARSLNSRSVDIKGLKGDLLLRIRAEYDQDGTQRETTVYVPVPRDPGGNYFMIQYAMLDPSDRKVSFDYWVDRSGGAEMIVPVWATVIDSEGRTAKPPVDPIDWSSDPNLDPDSKWADATDLNDDLTLILRTEYTGSDGKKHSSMAACPVVIIGRSTEVPMFPPDTSATITSLTRKDVSFTAALKTRQDYGSYYDPAVNKVELIWTDGNSNELAREYLGSNVTVEKSYDIEGGKSMLWGEWPDWSFTFSGSHSFFDKSNYRYDAAAVESAKYAYIEMTVYNRYTGQPCTVRSDMAPVPEESYPLGDGDIALTVYNDTPTNNILALEKLSEKTFTGYKLPAAKTPDGYDFAGWVVHVGNPLDSGGDMSAVMGYGFNPPVDAVLTADEYAFPVGATLTKEDVERVPPSDDGLRYVNVHACWIRRDTSDKLLRLDDGSGSVTFYSMMVPLESEGFLYLCRYPVPEREGFTFDGWYDADGKRVDMLVCYFSFWTMQYDADGKFTGYDTTKKAITLTAHWK